MHQSIAEQIQEARTLIDSSRQHPDIRQALANFGYPIKNLERGQALLEYFLLLQRAKRPNYEVRNNASVTISTELKQVKTTYKVHRALVSRASEGNHAVPTSLGYNEPHSNRQLSFIKQLTSFYAQLLPHHEALQRYGLTRAEIEQAQATVAALEEAQTHSQEEVRLATQKLGQALKNLQRWVRGYRAIVRVALADDPQLLEMLGLLVRM